MFKIVRSALYLLADVLNDLDILGLLLASLLSLMGNATAGCVEAAGKGGGDGVVDALLAS